MFSTIWYSRAKSKRVSLLNILYNIINIIHTVYLNFQKVFGKSSEEEPR